MYFPVPDFHRFEENRLGGCGVVRIQKINLVMMERSQDDARKEKERDSQKGTDTG